MSLETLNARLNYAGGDAIGRINKQKLKSFYAALENDYNSREILLPDNITKMRALINTNNLKPDYDKKLVSVDFGANLSAGDVFKCTDDNTHWMIYLPVLTETAYLQAEIIRCRYQIEVNGQTYWAYFQGPVETAISWNLSKDVNWNDLNFTGSIFIKLDDNTKENLKRFDTLKLNGHTWQIGATDSISVPGILELEIQEYFENTPEELPSVLKETTGGVIYGAKEVKPGTEVSYKISDVYYSSTVSWSISDNDNVSILDITDDGKICTVAIADEAIGEFKVNYGTYSYEIDITSTESHIDGPESVYPYSTYEYTVADTGGTFSVSNSLAKIISQTDGYCKLQIVTGKKGKFTLNYKNTASSIEYALDIKILSL